uniref:Secreted protein n=1 Tax=Streptomyces sp. NBC_00119 TaxID=2975659 RepID=A0AAU1UNT3_9ACTN
MPSVPPQVRPPHAQGPEPAAPARSTAWAEGVDRVRAAATTEPGRLRIIGAVLALLVVAFGAVTAWQMSDRSAAADDVLHSSQPLSADAADIYRSLADANTAASSGFLAGGQEPAETRDRYEKDIRTAAAKLVTAAANSDPDSPSTAAISKLNKLLPQYKGLIERARANNRQGFPLGGAYLRYANETMQEQMLPAAEDLYKKENERLRSDYDSATPYPWAAIGLGVVALGGLTWAQRRNYRRTNRVLNHGLVAATAASTVVLLWLVVGHSVARAGLDESYDHGVRSLNVLHDARIASLKARGNENLTLVSRGAETVEVKGVAKDAFDVDYQNQMKTLATKLGDAAKLADDSTGKRPVQAANDNMRVWRDRHKDARGQDDAGNYQGALDKVIGSAQDKPTRECFDNVDKELQSALTHEQAEFKQAATDGRGAMTGLPVGAAVLAVLGAAGAVLGIGRRLSEYR